jgi:hypothetical protein
VCVVGEPGAGRSDVIEALTRVLTPDFTRTRQASELDFYALDTTQRAEVEVVLGDLGNDFEQLFFDHLELWDIQKRQLSEEIEEPEDVDREIYEVIVRLCYRASWNAEDAKADHWVDYPKTSDPDSGLIERPGRRERESLRFTVINTWGRPLDMSSNGQFRRLVEGVDGKDFSQAVQDLEAKTAEIARAFSDTPQVSAALGRVLEPLQVALRLSGIKVSDIVTFLPEGGSVNGIMKSLAPAINVHDGLGTLPLQRHGSSLSAMLKACQALAAVGDIGIAAIDDLGDDLDTSMSQHLTATLRRSLKQVWVSTRRSHVAEAFQPDELVRLVRRNGSRQCFHGRISVTKSERLAARHRNLQLLPAITSRSVVIVEGPHDKASLEALAFRLQAEEGVPLPSALCVTIIDAGALGSGGSNAIPRLAQAAREMGFRAVAVVDYENDGVQADAELEENVKNADAVIRLPKGHAIERALVSGLDTKVLRTALQQLHIAFGAVLRPDIDTLSGPDLVKQACKIIKHNGLHAQFITALPKGTYPVGAKALLDKALEVSVDNTTGHVQL